MRRFQRRVYGLAWKIVRDRGTAEDVANGSYFSAVRLADPARSKARSSSPATADGSRCAPSGSPTAPGGALPVTLADVAAVHLVDAGGRPVLVARSS